MNCLKDPSLPLLELQVGWFSHRSRGNVGLWLHPAGPLLFQQGPRYRGEADELPKDPSLPLLELQVGYYFTSLMWLFVTFHWYFIHVCRLFTTDDGMLAMLVIWGPFLGSVWHEEKDLAVTLILLLMCRS